MKLRNHGSRDIWTCIFIVQLITPLFQVFRLLRYLSVYWTSFFQVNHFLFEDMAEQLLIELHLKIYFLLMFVRPQDRGGLGLWVLQRYYIDSAEILVQVLRKPPMKRTRIGDLYMTDNWNEHWEFVFFPKKGYISCMLQNTWYRNIFEYSKKQPLISHFW